MKKWNVQKFPRKPMNPRPRRQPHSTIEDAVSRVVVGAFMDEIVGFSQKLSNKLGGDAKMYSHGGYALKAFASTIPDLDDRVRNLRSDAKLAMEEVMVDPRDVDITVVPKIPISCNTFQSCMNNKVVKDVAEALRDLRRVIHNKIRGNFEQVSGLVDGLVREVNNELSSINPNNKTIIQKLWLTDLTHRHIQHNKSANKVMIVDRQQNNANVCNAGNMPLLDLGAPPTAARGSRSAAASASSKCYPLRDQLNSTLNFTLNFKYKGQTMQATADFVLCRLSLGIGFSYYDSANSQAVTTAVVPVNFVDVSIVRSEDSFYGDNVRDLPPSFRNLSIKNQPGFLPYATLGYVKAKTLMQHGTDANMLEKGETALGSETFAFTQRHMERMGRRLLAIFMLGLWSQEAALMSMRDMGSDQAQVEEVIRTILDVLPWSSELKAVMVKYAADIVLKLLVRGNSPRASKPVAVKSGPVGMQLDVQRSQLAPMGTVEKPTDVLAAQASMMKTGRVKLSPIQGRAPTRWGQLPPVGGPSRRVS